MTKKQMYGIAWFTLLAFPILAIAINYFIFGNIEFINGAKFYEISISYFFIGSVIGVLFAFFILKTMDSLSYEITEYEQIKLQISKLNLSLKDKLFVSFCAGFGEEFFFRLFLQKYLGIWVTAFIFIAIHGYFSPKNLKKNIIGFTILPFILVISYGYEYFGFWFAVASHFLYDFIMFVNVNNLEDETEFFKLK